MAPAPCELSMQPPGPPGALNRCLGLLQQVFCAYYYYSMGPSGRHMALLLHLGQVNVLLGGILLPLSYTVMADLPNIAVQEVIGLYLLEVGAAMVVAEVATSCMVHKRQAQGCSPFRSQDTLVVLYSYLGGGCTLIGTFTFVVYWLPSQDLPATIVVGSGITTMTGVLLLIGARCYGRTPCYRKRQVAHHQTDNEAGPSGGGHCSCPHSHPHHLHTISSTRVGARDLIAGPIVVYASDGVPPTHTLVPALPPALPPQYDTLPPFGATEDGPPGYMLVTPISPPPSYSEACDTPKETDADANALTTYGVAPPSYTPRVDTFVGTAHQSDCVIITDLSSSV